jgi:DNA-binding LacI/PurR family transcriptional regulator
MPLMRESGVSQHAIERFLDGEKRVHPATRLKIARAVERLEPETHERAQSEPTNKRT